MAGLTLDTGALIALERNDRRAWGFSRIATERGQPVCVPAGCLAQFWRSNHPRVARVLAGATVDALTHRNALEVGRLLARTGTVDVVDASVALGAVARDQAVVTSDPDDFERIASAAGLGLRVLRV